jgi:hypothetical protein
MGPASSAGLQSPTDVAVDASGDLYIMAGNAVRHVDASGTITTVAGNGGTGGYQGEGGSATSASLGASGGNILLDGAGNLYLAATAAHRLVEVPQSQAALLSFDAQTLGTTSAAQIVTLTNNGNQPLTLSQLNIPANFLQQSAGSSACSATTTLNSGAACQIALTFTPSAIGPLNGTLTIADNALNGTATQTIALTGTGQVSSTGFNVNGLGSSVMAGSSASLAVSAITGGVANTGYVGTVHFTSSDPQAMLPADYTFTSADNGTHTFSNIVLKTSGTQSITLTDTAQPALIGYIAMSVTAGAPATIKVSGAASQSATVGTAFASPLAVLLTDAYQNPVASTVVTFTAPASGASAAFTGGTNQVSATTNTHGIATTPSLTANSVAGAYGVAASVSGLTPTAVFSLTNVAARAATTVTLSASSATPIVGRSVTITAAVTSTQGTPTGNVVFSDGTKQLGSVALAQGVATYTTSALSLGAHSIVASYAGDTTFLGAQSSKLAVTVDDCAPRKVVSPA